LKQNISSLKLVPSSGGAFEVTVNGTRIHSKLQSGQFPEPDKIVQTIRSMR
jgi:selenoprotein W-related protein